MKKSEIKLFCCIADLAMQNGFEISLEKRNYKMKSSALNGVLTNSESEDNGIMLRVYRSDCDDEEESEKDESEEDSED